jgi:hypothetical protein
VMLTPARRATSTIVTSLVCIVPDSPLTHKNVLH